MLPVNKKLLVALPFAALVMYSFGFSSFAMDEYTYMNTARSFSQGNFFEVEDAGRFPLFPFLLSITYNVFGSSEFVSRLFPIFLGAVGVFLTYFLTRELFGEKTAFWSALVFGSSPFYVFLTARVLTESLFILLLIACTWFLIKSTRNPKFFIALGFLFACLLLTRYIGLYFLPVALAYLWISNKKELLRSKWIWAGAVVFLLTLTPWLLYSNALTGSPLGLISSFFVGQIQVGEVKMGLPDKIPSYLLTTPFLLAAATPLLWLGFPEAWRKRRENKFLCVLVTVLVIAGVMEAYGFVHPRLLRYLVPVTPFLSIIAGNYVAKIKKEKVLWIAVALVLANATLAGAVIHWFANYPKHVAYYEAGQFMAQHCSGVVASNLGPVVQYFIGKESLLKADGAQCVAISDYEGISKELSVPLDYKLAFEKYSVRIYVR